MITANPSASNSTASTRITQRRGGFWEPIKDGAEIHAWNANFEFLVWNNICAPRFGWPKLEIEKFFCTMCAAACAGLPMNLGEAAIAVGSPYLKDKVGQALMKRMARPRSDKGGVVRWWHREDPAKVAQLVAYNIGDVRAEREVHMRTPRMTKREREIWLVDQRMNMRGLPIDAKLLDKMYEITLAELLDLNATILQLTNGAVRGSTQAAALLAWVQAGGYPHATLERETLFDFVKTEAFHELASEVQEVLLTRAEAAKTSTAKLLALSRHAGRDGFVRNLIQYGGAVRTLRWGGRGPSDPELPHAGHRQELRRARHRADPLGGRRRDAQASVRAAARRHLLVSARCLSAPRRA